MLNVENDKKREQSSCLEETKYLYHQSNSKVEVYSRNLIFSHFSKKKKKKIQVSIYLYTKLKLSEI